jgi:hypothetical protein
MPRFHRVPDNGVVRVQDDGEQVIPGALLTGIAKEPPLSLPTSSELLKAQSAAAIIGSAIGARHRVGNVYRAVEAG